MQMLSERHGAVWRHCDTGEFTVSEQGGEGGGDGISVGDSISVVGGSSECACDGDGSNNK